GGDLGHLALHLGLALALGVVEGGDDQVLDHAGVLGLEQRRIDADRAHLALAGQGDGDHAAARAALDHQLGQFGLHGLHLRLHLAGGLHHAHDVFHSSSSSCGGGSPSGSAAASSRTVTLTSFAPGNVSIMALTSGSSWAAAVASCWRCSFSCRLVSPSGGRVGTITSQRSPVQFCRRADSVAMMPGSAPSASATSMRPFSKEIGRIWLSSASLTSTSRLAAA